MPIRRYIDENGLAAMLVVKRSAGVTLEVNLREHVRYTPPPKANEAAQSRFETLRRGISDPTKMTYVLQIIFLKCDEVQMKFICVHSMIFLKFTEFSPLKTDWDINGLDIRSSLTVIPFIMLQPIPLNAKCTNTYKTSQIIEVL